MDFFSQLKIFLKKYIHTNIQAEIQQLLTCKSSFWRVVQISNVLLKHEKCPQLSAFLKSYVKNINTSK